jgi:hypothetical protein
MSIAAARTLSGKHRVTRLSAERILAGLDGRIEPAHTSLGYRVALTAVAVVMVLLPVVYLALIAARRTASSGTSPTTTR